MDKRKGPGGTVKGAFGLFESYFFVTEILCPRYNGRRTACCIHILWIIKSHNPPAMVMAHIFICFVAVLVMILTLVTWWVKVTMSMGVDEIIRTEQALKGTIHGRMPENIV